MLQHSENALLIRPHWGQLDSVSAHWKALLLHLQTNDQGEDNALVGRRDGRNFGYGRQLSYAGRRALEDLFAGGHFATIKAHSDRWQAFVRWCRSSAAR